MSTWDALKRRLGIQYGMPFLDNPDEPELPFGIDLGSTHVLPKAQLDQLVAQGKLMSITSFDEHMRPDVHWITPAEFGEAFDQLTKGETIMPKEVAYTESAPVYPGFLNIQPLPPEPTSADPLAQRDEFDTIQLLMRGSPRTVPAVPAPIGGTGGQNESTVCGDLVKLNMPVDAWDAIALQVNRWRAGELTGYAPAAEPPTTPDPEARLQYLAERFCAAPLPADVAADVCATEHNYPHTRHGTSLLTVAQAKDVLRYVLAEG